MSPDKYVNGHTIYMYVCLYLELQLLPDALKPNASAS